MMHQRISQIVTEACTRWELVICAHDDLDGIWHGETCLEHTDWLASISFFDSRHCISCSGILDHHDRGVMTSIQHQCDQ